MDEPASKEQEESVCFRCFNTGWILGLEDDEWASNPHGYCTCLAGANRQIEEAG